MRKRRKLTADEMTGADLLEAIQQIREMNEADMRLIQILDDVAREMDAHAERLAANPQDSKKA